MCRHTLPKVLTTKVESVSAVTFMFLPGQVNDVSCIFFACQRHVFCGGLTGRLRTSRLPKNPSKQLMLWTA